MMRAMWGVALAATLCVSGLSSETRAEVEDVDCGRLKRIAIGDAGGYDEVDCMAGGMQGHAAGGDGDGKVGGYIEVIVAYSRASFAVIRFIETDRRTYLQAQSLQEYIETALDMLEPRNWGGERRHDRFALADMQAKVMDDSPFLDCVAFLRWGRSAGGAPGYLEAMSGLYCAMDRLKPTEAEVTEFLDGLKF